MNLHDIFDIVEQSWHFDVEHYPHLPEEGTPQEERRALTARVGHVLLHLQKQVGQLAGMVEPLAHSGSASISCEEVGQQIAYLFIDAAKLEQLAGVEPEQISAVVRKYGKAHAPLPVTCSVCNCSLGEAPIAEWEEHIVHLVCPTYRPNVIDVGMHPYLKEIFWQECIRGGIYSFEGDFAALSAEAQEHEIIIEQLPEYDGEFEVCEFL